MSLPELTFRGVTPRGYAERALRRYGLGTLFAANVLGAGSVYILAQTGASVGFMLLWVLPLAFAMDMVMHDMSSRLATEGRPLMRYIDSVLQSWFGRPIGRRASIGFSVSMALVMQLWSVANYAVAGAVISWFVGVPMWTGIVGAASLATVLVVAREYKTVEAIISALMVTVFVVYATIALSLDIDGGAVLNGLTPGAVSDPTLIIAMLGTTVYYPNFFIQSSMRPTKGWVNIKKYRRDNAVGVGFSVLVSAGMLVVAAVTLAPSELSLTDPAIPLVDAVGGWALPVFMIAVLCASFTSATGTLFGSSFAVPQSFGHRTEFGDTAFTTVTVVLIAISTVLAIWALNATSLTPVRMAIVMPAVNGAIYLPITILSMYGATRGSLGRKQKVATLLALVVMTAGSVLTAQSLATTITNWI